MIMRTAVSRDRVREPHERARIGPQRAVLAGALATLLALWICIGERALPVDEPDWTTRFDGYFRKNGKHYFGPAFDWRWIKAQSITESSLRPGAVSRVGARGLMQILPSTFDDIRKRYPYFDALDDPRWNVAAGVYWLREQYDKWRGRVAPRHRMRFAFASYNAGFRRILDARQGARAHQENPREWSAVAGYAPADTRQYVERIHVLMGQAQ